MPSKSGGRFKPRNLSYLFNSADTVYVRCHFNEAPAHFQRRARGKKDYWRIRVHWAGRWQKLLTYGVSRPLRRKDLGLKIPVRDIAAQIRRSERNGMKWPGKWLRVQASYMVITQKGWRWSHGVRVPVYEHTTEAATTFFVRWR